MDQKTRDALEGSIAKWQRIVDREDIDHGCSNCPLCGLFNSVITENSVAAVCYGCPVHEKTGCHGCEDTPYEEWAGLAGIRVINPRTYSDEQLAAAREELTFLISLRPNP